MCRKQTLFLCLFLSPFFLIGQTPEYLGSGNHAGIVVTSSGHYIDTFLWPDTARAIHTIDGKGLDADYFDAGRFLMQASLGYEEHHMEEVIAMGMEDWIDAQFDLPATYILTETEEIFQLEIDSMVANGVDSADLPLRPGWTTFNYAWWQVNMTNEDLLRHKVAAALSEILVISRLSDLAGYGDGMADYYDILLEHSFGNYRDLLYDVTTHPCMGFYLTHLNNPKTDTSQNIRPDENYAREIMQLFTIGLYELNMNGTRKVVNGSEIATYGQDDIRELAKVFTGLGVGDVIPNPYDDEPRFGMGLYFSVVTTPMIMWDEDDPVTTWLDEDQHENGDKFVLGQTIHDNASGLHEINQALDILFHHDNMAPFLAYRMIQRLIKSNPSPAYVSRVAHIFEDNGSGVRGDMKAFIKAILLDPEARACPNAELPKQNRLKEPLFRYTHFARMIDKYNPNDYYWNVNYQFFNEVKQDILASPSVFNFFLPDDTPNGPISNQNLVAPEFKLHDSRTSTGYMNRMFAMAMWGTVMDNWSPFEFDEVIWDKSDQYQLTRDPEYYINFLDRRFTHGTLTDDYRNYIRDGLNRLDLYTSWHDAEEFRTGLGMYFILVSPEYSILK